jgi:hypothetical protein
MAKEENQERSFGEAVADITDSSLRTIANGGSTLQVLASGGLAALNTESFQAEKKKRANAARLAELEIQQREQNLQQDAETYEYEKNMRPLRRRSAELGVQSLQQNLQQGKARFQHEQEMWQYDKDKAEHEKSARDFEKTLWSDTARASKARADSEEARAGMNLLAQQQAQQEVWRNDFEKNKKNLKKNIYKSVGYDALNIHAQDALDNSENLEAFMEASLIFRAYSQNDAEGDYLLREAGWLREEREDGTYLISDAGDLQLKLDQNNIKNIMTQIQERMRDDIAAAKITGQDAASIEDYATKNVLNAPGISNIFGTDGAALASYRNVLETGIPATKDYPGRPFTKAEIIGHQLSTSLQSAILDGKISEEEKKILTPLFAATVKQMGGEVLFGENIESTVIKRGDGSTVPLTTAAVDLARRDIVSAVWNAHVKDIQKQVTADETQAAVAGGGSDIIWKNKLDNMYGTDFREATDAERDKVVEVAKKMEIEEKGLMDEVGAKTMNDLSLDHLRLLDHEWINKIDNKKFYSPYQDMIFVREREELYKEKAPLIAELRELEKNTSEYREYISGRRGPTPQQKKLLSLRSKIDDINDAIKMREDKLSKRGVKFEEYK